MHDCRVRAWALIACAGMVATFGREASAQTVSTYLGGSGTTTTAQQSWTTGGNWAPSGVPNGSGAWAQIQSGPSVSGTLRILYTSTLFSANTLDVGAISLLPTLAASTGSTFSVQNNGTSAKGTLRFFGVDTTIDDVPRRVILVNSSTFTNVSFTQTNAGQDFELHTSGAIHVADGTQLTLTPTIKDGTGSQSITKTGAGILTFSGSTSATSTYAGGFVLEGGVVQWALSGSAAGNPFGTGPVTLRSGTLRSTTTSGRSITNSMILDGAVTLGSTEDGLTGTITINSAGGSLSTTLVSDSVVTIVAGGSTAWNQSVSGSGSLTKAGAGLLRFTPLSTLSHTGSTVVTEGTLLMAGSLTSPGPVSVQSGGTLQGTGTIAGVTTIEAGGILAPGANLGVLSFVSDLTLSGAADLELTGTTRGSAYDAVDVDGLLTYGGTLLLQIPSVLSDGTYELFKGFNSHAGSFATITLSGAYAGNLTETAGVWSGSFGGQDISFTNATGSLVIVPEPRAILLAGLGLALAVRCLRWRVTRRE